MLGLLPTMEKPKLLRQLLKIHLNLQASGTAVNFQLQLTVMVLLMGFCFVSVENYSGDIVASVIGRSIIAIILFWIVQQFKRLLLLILSGCAEC